MRKHLQTAEDDANFYRDKVLDSDDLTDIAQLVDGKMDALRADIETAAARIIEGAEIAIDISRVPRSMRNDMPKTPVVMESVRVDTLGVEYPEPETR